MTFSAFVYLYDVCLHCICLVVWFDVGWWLLIQRVSCGVQMAAADAPGPGAYSIPTAFSGKAKGSSTSESASPLKQGSVSWQRVHNPPSIPTREQSYGYERGDDGKFVPQHKPVAGHTGRGAGALLESCLTSNCCSDRLRWLVLPQTPLAQASTRQRTTTKALDQSCVISVA